MKKPVIGSFLVLLISFASVCGAEKLREVIVSHTDDNGVLQLFCMKEDGSGSVQITHSKKGCRMPVVSPDGKKLVYVQLVNHSLSLWLSGINGKNPRVLINDGMNLLPSWLPDSRHIVWMKAQQNKKNQDPASNSQIHILDTETGKSRRLFTDPEQIKFSNAMPSVSFDGKKVAFVSNRSGTFRVWVSNLEGSDAKLISSPPKEQDENLKLPIEQKVPTWSPDGKWIAHWEGVEMIHMSPYTGIKNPKRDQQISATFNVWVVSSDGTHRRKVGRGDDPTWSPDGFVTRAFPDPGRGGPKIMIETKTGEKQLPIVPPKTNWGRFSWLSNPSPKSQHPAPWTFVSIPDFLNFDIEYPQKGWEDALGFIVDSMKKENPAFAMVAGDLVMGHWGTSKKEIDQWADKYYPAWTRRFQDHGLKVYTALGDHEVADNPWRGDKAAAVSLYKDAFRRHLGMPLNGPDHMKGTAFYWLHKNALFVSVDVFEKGKSNQGEIAAGVTGRQLEWFEKVVSEHRPKVDHIVVMGHTPILRPVRTYSSSGMLTLKGRDSDFWKVMAKHGVDLYLCGEVHAVTCIQRDGIQQVAHGGLIGRTTKPNYMVVTVHKDRLNLDIKEIDLINGKGRLWQKNKSRGPWDTITITAERKEQGFISIGKIVINKVANTRKFEAATGFFVEENNPKANSRSKN